MIFFVVLVGMFFVALIFYKKQRPQWKKSLLLPDETVLYTQVQTTIYTTGSDGVRRGMAWAAIRFTNKRIFFLYPDKKAISKVLDFSGEKYDYVDEKLQRNVVHLDRVSMTIETDVQGRQNFCAKAVGPSGEILKYTFLVHDVAEIKKILGI